MTSKAGAPNSERDYLAVCEALGIVYHADGHAPAAAPIEDVLREIERLQRSARAVRTK